MLTCLSESGSWNQSSKTQQQFMDANKGTTRGEAWMSVTNLHLIL